MIGLDSNVLLRYIAQDDAKQSPLATRLIESLTPDDPGFVSQVVLAEVVWVVESCYAADADRISQVVETLLQINALQIEGVEVVWRALRHFRAQRGDFSDTLIAEIATAVGCHLTYSFDRGAVNRCGMTGIK